MELIDKNTAREKGLIKYFTGKPCSNGHYSERYVSGGKCVTCVSERDKKYSERDDIKERKSLYNKSYYKDNYDTIRQQSRQWVIDNNDRYRETQKRYALENSKRKTIKAKEWRIQNPDKYKESIKRYVLDHKAERIAAANARKACKLQRTPSWSDLSKIREIYKECSVISKSTGIPHHVDHIVPLQGKLVCGLHVPNNLQILPAGENLKKHNKFESQ